MYANAIRGTQVEFVISQFAIILAAFTVIVLLQTHASVKSDGKVVILHLNVT
jgi:glucose uptake protein GlcU